MTKNTRSQLAALLALLAVCLAAGCGDTGRLPIKGIVKVDGTRLKDGYIVFLPVAGTPGPTAGSKIVDGSYEVDSSKGVFDGEFRVEIKGWRDSNRTSEDSVTGQRFAEPEQFLPAKYNSDSKLTRAIKSGSESCDFDLEM